MKTYILIHHKRPILNYISSKAIYFKLYFSLLLFCYTLCSVAQTNVKSGNIRDCDVWNFPASGTNLNNAKIINQTTIQSHSTTTNVSSIQLNGNSTVKMGSGDKINITPGGITDASGCPATVSSYSSRASNDFGMWLFNGNGNIYQVAGGSIKYISGANVTANVSGEYVIRGVIFVAQTLQNGLISGTAENREMGFVRKKTVDIALSLNDYAGTGNETIIGTLSFNFSTPVTDHVDGAWKYTTTICDYDATSFLSTSTCLQALRDPGATLAPFLLGDVDYGFKCYNNMDRITESGLLTFEYIPPTLPTFAAGQKIFLTIKNIRDPDLANKSISTRFLNFSAEIYLQAKKQF